MTCKSSQVQRKMDEYGGPAAFCQQKFAEHAAEFTDPIGCADCHTPYQRVGSVKVTDHWIQSPMQHLNRSCQNCHRWPEAELAGRVEAIQDRTAKMLERAELAIIALIDDIKGAMAEGATDEQLEPARRLHRKAQFRWDFVAAENSVDFHSPHETLRILGESIDLARQGQLEVTRLRETLRSTP